MTERAWRIVEVAPGDKRPEEDLTDSELVGISVLLTHQCGEPRTERNVYWRARQKIQYAVEVALDDGDEAN